MADERAPFGEATDAVMALAAHSRRLNAESSTFTLTTWEGEEVVVTVTRKPKKKEPGA
jgi:hypothetical protein